jgi:hypothetical protein
MIKTLKVVACAALMALFFCLFTQAADAAQVPSDTPPAPLSDPDKFDMADMRGKLLENALTQTSIIQQAEQEMQKARTEILKQRDEKLSALKSAQDVMTNKLNERHTQLSKTGWKLNFNTYVWEKAEPQPEEQTKTSTVGTTAITTKPLTQTTITK